ncbi:response regulator [Brachybacterium sp. DNPG3]
MIRLVIADDHPVVRAGLHALLDTAPDVEVIGEASTPDEAVALAAELNPDLVLMDLQFGPVGSSTGGAGSAGSGAHGANGGASGGLAGGADATRRIRADEAAPYVLVLTNYDSDGDILGAVEAGASGYLLKDAPPEELLAAVRAAAAGESALAPAVASRLMARMRSPRVSLSAREIEVLRLVAAGASNSEVAERLHITDATVKSHLVHVFSKLDVSSRTAAVSAARDLGILR